MKIKYLLFMSLAFILVSCEGLNPEYVPAELMGTWEGDNSAGCTETWIFTSNNLHWKQFCPLMQATDNVYYPIDGFDETYNALHASNGYWFLYHLESSTELKIRRWDDDTDLSSIDSNWYESRGAGLSKVY